jgi:hypothetical protein
VLKLRLTIQVVLPRHQQRQQPPPQQQQGCMVVLLVLLLQSSMQLTAVRQHLLLLAMLLECRTVGKLCGGIAGCSRLLQLLLFVC